jgi:type VI secretion system protein ImpG
MLSPVDEGGQPDLPAEEVLSIDLTCTNGEYAASLGPGKLTNAISPIAGRLRPVNLNQPTRPYWPMLGDAGSWRLLSHASLSFVSIGSSDQLRSMLELYDAAATPENERRLSGIRGVEVKPAHAMLRGSLVPGSLVELLIDEERFPDSGDVQVFARVMSAFLEAYAAINSHTQLAVRLERANSRFALPPAFGQRETI